MGKKIGKDKQYHNIAGSMIAFVHQDAINRSKGIKRIDGSAVLFSKNEKLERKYKETYNMKPLFGGLLKYDVNNGFKLIEKYLKVQLGN